jgi:hypothetical protein
MSATPEIAAGERRRRRAALARRVLEKAPSAAAALDWAQLGSAPDWLALSEPALALRARRIGALLCAPAMRLWIDGRRLSAARAALGDAYLQAVLDRRDVPAVEPADRPRLDAAEHVGPLLQATGGGVLLASLAPGALQRVATDLLAPVATLEIAPVLAESLMAQARVLEDKA